MRQFDLYKNPDPVSARRLPFVVVLQSDLLTVIETVVVAPLALASRTKVVPRLIPTIEIAGVEHAILVHDMAAIARTQLKRQVGTAAAKRDELIAAIDLIFTGF
ncbi:MAG: CcdB family protein [Micropepsaceae bacterium]